MTTEHRSPHKSRRLVFRAVDWPIQHCYFIERQHMLNSSRLLRRHGIDHVQWRILVSLMEKDGRGVSEIAARCGLERTTLSKLLDKIEAKELIARTTEQRDRRRSRVLLTPKGRATYAKCAPLVLNLFHDYFDEFSEEEMASMMSMLRRIRAKVEERAAKLADTSED